MMPEILCFESLIGVNSKIQIRKKKKVEEGFNTNAEISLFFSLPVPVRECLLVNRIKR